MPPIGKYWKDNRPFQTNLSGYADQRRPMDSHKKTDSLPGSAHPMQHYTRTFPIHQCIWNRLPAHSFADSKKPSQPKHRSRCMHFHWGGHNPPKNLHCFPMILSPQSRTYFGTRHPPKPSSWHSCSQHRFLLQPHRQLPCRDTSPVPHGP